MATVISGSRVSSRQRALRDALAKILPYKLFDLVRKLQDTRGGVEEIRCRRDRRVFVTLFGENLMLDYTIEKVDMERMVDAICGGSLYAHRETILEGYVSMEGGIRVGLCGRAAVEHGRIIGVFDITGINIRLPCDVGLLGGRVCRLLRDGGGALVYSPPGEGKTTLLRCVANAMASGSDQRRVCVIDSRGELFPFLDGSASSIDVLVGYPKDKGIEIATRTMNAQLIVCDEIGDDREAEAILGAENCGVPLLATAHGSSIESIMRRTAIRRLHDAAVFSYYVGIKRRSAMGELDYTVTQWEDANAFI